MGKIEQAFMGWKCPECGRVFSPFLHTCPYCSGEEIYKAAEVQTPKENSEIKINIPNEILTEWQYGPAEGGD